MIYTIGSDEPAATAAERWAWRETLDSLRRIPPASDLATVILEVEMTLALLTAVAPMEAVRIVRRE